ncbi:hypothetical protein LJC68_08945 [Bacteroidales bacterium OttesenSCG-928-B11]|nr:hypothetical protein [Bacteroidales bacterium OttesenSCG-928-B11]
MKKATTTTKKATETKTAKRAKTTKKMKAETQELTQPQEQTQPQTAQAEQTELKGLKSHFARLQEVSRQARELKAKAVETAKTEKQRQFLVDRSLNYFIMNYIYNGLSQPFKTLDDWNAEGAKVKKGEKAFPIWGAPVPAEKKRAGKAESLFYPILLVFHNSQVVFEGKPVPTQAMPF